jgi:eukaryotic-like serine/threonine-protein kinase
LSERKIGQDDPADAAREAALASYLEAAAAGRPLDRQALAADPELAAFLTRHDQLADLGSWWRVAVGEASAATVAGDPTAPFNAWAYPSALRLPAIPGYEMLREIARGGMGVVYEARQTSLNRPVAVKIILQGGLASPIERRRFAAEAAAAAKLKHPNIVVIHEVGEHEGQPFFSMEYVAGDSLSRILHRSLPAPLHAAHYAREVARAVQFAHENGVLHRDIKPSNVLVDDSGRVRVMDFGLAKQIDADDKLTVTGQLLGTPSYMAPEQISGSAGEIGPACDVYGLGALLYELLTGQPPFYGGNQVETLLAALESDPPAPRRINQAVPRALEMIALKCLEKEPGDRYASAAEVAADLDRFIAGESLSISSPNLLDRVARTLERSQFDREVQNVSRFVMQAAWIALAAHAAVFLNYYWRSPHPLAGVVGIRLAEFAAMLTALWPRLAEWFPPRGAAARQLWSIWLGYLAGSLTLFLADYLLTPPGEAFYGLRAYPPMAVLASLAFFMLGSSYWGYCHLLGVLFLGLALLMTQWLPAAPAAFGLGWAASLLLLGVRLRRLAQEGR